MENLMREMMQHGNVMIPESPETAALLEEIQKKEQQFAKLEAAASGHKEAFSNMQEHLKRQQDSLPVIQALCVAVENDTSTNRHLEALAQREMERQRQDTAHRYKEDASQRERENTLENRIFRAKKKIEDIKARVNWDQKRLEAWVEETARNDDNLMALSKYTKEDEGKIRDLTLCLEKLNVEAYQKKNALDNKTAEATVVQMAQNKTLKMIQQVQKEKQQLLSKWETTVKQLEKKDQDLQKLASLIEKRNAVSADQKALMKKLEEFEAREVQNNKEIQKKIEENKREASKLQQQCQEEECNCVQLKDEVVSLKGQCGRVARELEDVRSTLRGIKREAKRKAAQIEKMQTNNASLKVKLQTAIEKGLSKEEKAAQMEKHLGDEKKALKADDIKLQQVNKLLFEKKTERQMLQDKVKTNQADILGSRAALANQKKNLDKMDRHIVSRMDCNKKQKLQICRLEEKLAHLTGNIDKEQKLTLENQVSGLKQKLEEKKKATAEIKAHLQKVQCEQRCVKKETEKMEAKKRNSKVEEMDLINDSMDKELKGLQQKKQGIIVDTNIMQMEVNRAKIEVEKKVSAKRSLEMRKLERLTAMKVQTEELSVCRDMNRKQCRILQKELHKLRLQFNAQSSRVENLKSKYKIVSMSMGVPEDQLDNVQNFLFLKAAQNVEEKVEKREALRAQIEKAEKETAALRNTLWLINMGIEEKKKKAREAKQKQMASHPDYTKKIKWEERIKTITERVNFKRQQIEELKKNTEDLSSQLNTLQQESSELRRTNAELETRLNKQKKKYNSKRERLDRAKKRCSMLLRKIRARRKAKNKTLNLRPIMKKVRKAISLMAIRRLVAAMDKNPDLEEIVHTYFTQAGVPVPRLPFHVPSQRRTKLLIAQNSSVRNSTSVPSSARSSADPKTPKKDPPASSKSDAYTPSHSVPSSARSSAAPRTPKKTDPPASSTSSPRAQTLTLTNSKQTIASSARGSAPAKKTVELGRGSPASSTSSPRAPGINAKNGAIKSVPQKNTGGSVPPSKKTVEQGRGSPASSKPSPRAPSSDGNRNKKH